MVFDIMPCGPIFRVVVESRIVVPPTDYNIHFYTIGYNKPLVVSPIGQR